MSSHSNPCLTTLFGARRAHARKAEGGSRIALLIPLHPKDLPKLHTLLRSAYDFVADFEELSLYTVVTSDAEVALVREALREVSPT